MAVYDVIITAGSMSSKGTEVSRVKDDRNPEATNINHLYTGIRTILSQDDALDECVFQVLDQKAGLVHGMFAHASMSEV